MKRIILLLVFSGVLVVSNLSGQNMSIKKIDKLLVAKTDSIEREFGRWQFYYKGVKMVLLTDEFHNRMRIMSPIIYIDELKPDYFKKSLEANFHTALDIKYAISDGIMWSLFIHPLKELSEEQLVDALEQVSSGAKTFGSSYSSSNLYFQKK